MTCPNSKAPALLTARGALGEQLSFLPPPTLSVILPTYESREGQALMLLSIGSLTQEEWLDKGKGWRLAAVMHQLKLFGWPISFDWVTPKSRSKQIKRYYLSATAIQLAYSWSMHTKESTNDAEECTKC